MSFRNYFISKSPFVQMGDPLKDLMNKLYTKNNINSSTSNDYTKSTNLSAKYNPNKKGKTGAENLLNTSRDKSTKEEIKKGLL